MQDAPQHGGSIVVTAADDGAHNTILMIEHFDPYCVALNMSLIELDTSGGGSNLRKISHFASI